MRKIHFLMGVIFLSTILVSCSNDDNFQQQVQNQKRIKKEENFKTLNVSSLNNSSNNIIFDNGDVSKDKDKNTGK